MRSILLRLVAVTVAVVVTAVAIAFISESETARAVFGGSIVLLAFVGILACAFARKSEPSSEESS